MVMEFFIIFLILIFIAKFFLLFLNYLNHFHVKHKEIYDQIEHLVNKNNIDRAIKLCNQNKSKKLLELFKDILIRSNNAEKLTTKFYTCQKRIYNTRTTFIDKVYFITSLVLGFLITLVSYATDNINEIAGIIFLSIYSVLFIVAIIVSFQYFKTEQRNFSYFYKLNKLLFNRLNVKMPLPMNVWTPKEIQEQKDRIEWFEENWKTLKEDEQETAAMVYNRVIRSDGMLPTFEGGLS
jgi:hypothetical protein